MRKKEETKLNRKRNERICRKTQKLKRRGLKEKPERRKANENKSKK